MDPVVARLVIMVVAALVACAPPLDPPECQERTKDHLRFIPGLASAEDPPEGEGVNGHILAWDVPEALFEAIDGRLFGFGLALDGDAVLPSLPTEAVRMTAYGFDPAPGDPVEPSLAITTTDKADPALHLFAGNVEVLDPLAGWTVESPRDVDWCGAFQGEAGAGHNKPVYFTHTGGTEATLFQAQTVEIDGWELTVLSAQSNNRDHPFAPCSNEDCPWEKLSWTIRQLEL